MTNEQQYIHDRITELKTLVAEGLEQNRIDVTERSQRLIESFLENTISGYKAMNEPTYFDNKGLNKIDNGWGAVGEKLGNQKRWEDPLIAIREAVKNNVPKPRDWSQATPSKVPVERWKPEVGATYWVVIGNGVPQSTSWINSKLDGQYFEMGNCFQTIEEALAARDRVKKALKGE